MNETSLEKAKVKLENETSLLENHKLKLLMASQKVLNMSENKTFLLSDIIFKLDGLISK